MTPYYEADGITIYHGDCRLILPQVTADVMVTDPPYGMAYTSGYSGRSVEGDRDPLIRDWALERWAGRPTIVFGRWDVPRPAGTRMLLIWDKGDWPGMGDLTMPWGPSTEEIYILGDGFAGRRSGQIIRDPKRPKADTHPTAKPVGLMVELLSKCPPGVIVDPFMGGGATLEAAKQLGRKAIGIEMEEKYCAMAASRLRQGCLF